MMRCRLGQFSCLLTIVGAVLASNAQATTNPDLVNVVGMGGESCASAFLPGNVMRTKQWIYGFVSARNDAGPNPMVGENTDPEGIAGEVRLKCQRAPSDSLYWATKQTYSELARAGR